LRKEVIYFEETGAKNTDVLLAAAKKRARELKIRDIVVATTHGGTALKAKEVLDGSELNLVAVGICEGYKEKG